MRRLLLLWLAPACCAAAAADIAVVNARVWTGDASRPWATAIAAAGERIVAVGGDDEVRAAAGGSARVMDARGGMVVPGFHDCHIHLSSFDWQRPLPPLFLRFLNSRAEVAERISGYAAQLPKGAWILGIDLPERLFRGPSARRWLDTLAPDHPVWLVNQAGDRGMANSAALRLARFEAADGTIEGGPMWHIDAAVAERSRARDDAAVEALTARLARAGVTSAQHNNSWYDFLILKRVREQGRLHVRVYAAPSLPGWRRLRDYIAENGRGDAWLHWGAVKGYGAITEEWYGWIAGASAAGLQVMTHLGSEAELRTLAGIYERVRREQKLADPRFRIEHGHDLPPDVIPQMARAGVIASWQPAQLRHTDQRTAAGQPQPLNLFGCRRLLEAGVKIAFGTDAQPAGEYTTPMESLEIALTRAAGDGTRLTLDEALRGFTRDAAYAEFSESEKGTLQAGKLADFVVLDRDLGKMPVERFHEVNVVWTVAGGRVTYER